MENYKYQTRTEFVQKARLKNPRYEGRDDDYVYKDMIDYYPEYQQQIAENYEPPPEQGGFPDEEELAQDPKNAFSALKNVFSKDFYKYVPFVRDAEFFELGKMLRASNALKAGNASEDQIKMLKEWVAEEDAPTTWGYRTLSTVFHSIPFMLEFLGTTALAAITGGLASGGVAAVGAKNVAKSATKAGIKKTVRAKLKQLTRIGIKRATRKISRTAVGSAIKNSAKKISEVGAKTGIKGFAARQVSQGWKDVGGMAFEKKILWASKQASKKGLRTSLEKIAEAEGKSLLRVGAERLGGALKTGARQAAIRTAFRSPDAIKDAWRRQIGDYNLEPGLEGDLMLKVMDEGDNIIPALAKGYLNMGIENFSESVGESLYLMDNLWGGEVIRKSFMKNIINPASKTIMKTPAGKAINAHILQGPLKAVLMKHFLARKTGGEAMDLLRKAGFQGVIGEMFEERVGDVMRAATGLQDNWMPTLDQLTSEAVAFSMSGAMASASHSLYHTKVLEGAGVESYARMKELIRPNAEGKVVVDNNQTKEFTGIVDEIVEEYKNQKENPSKIREAIRNFEIRGNKPFENLPDRGSVDSIMKEYAGTTLSQHIAKSVESGASKEETYAVAEKALDGLLRDNGIYAVVHNKVRQKQVREDISNGDMEFVQNDKHQGFWTISKEAYERSVTTRKDGSKRVQALEEGLWLDADLNTIEHFYETGLLEGVSLQPSMFKADVKDKEALAGIDAVAKMFRTTNRQQAEMKYDFIREMVRNSGGKLDFKMLGNVRAVDTPENYSKRGYDVEGKEGEMVYGFVKGMNKRGTVSFSMHSNLTDDFEEYLEANVSMSEDLEEDEVILRGLQGFSESIRMVIEDLEEGKNKGSNIDKLSGMELLSKAYIVRVLGQRRGQYTEALKNLKLSAEEDALLEQLITDAVGEKFINYAKGVIGLDLKAQSIDEDVVEDVAEGAEEVVEEESKVEPTDDTSEEEKPVEEAPAKVSEAIQEVIEGKAGKETIVDAINEVADTLEPEEFSNSLDIKEALLLTDGKDSDQVLAKKASKLMSEQGFHYHIEIAKNSKESLLDVMEEQEQGVSFDADATLFLLRSQVTSQISAQLGDQTGLDLMISLLNKDDVIRKQLSTIQGMNEFLSTPRKNGGERVLQKALNSIKNGLINREEKPMTADDANTSIYRIMKAEMNLYNNAHPMVVMDMNINESGKATLRTLNAIDNYAVLDQIMINHFDRITRDANALKYVSIGIDHGKHRTFFIKKLSQITGLPRGVVEQLDTADLKRVIKSFIELMDSEDFQLKGSHLKRTEMLIEQADKELLIETIVKKSGGDGNYSAMFTGSDRKLTTSIRMDSQLTRFAKRYAKTLGVSEKRILMMLDTVTLWDKKGTSKVFEGKKLEDRKATNLMLFDQSIEIDEKKYYYQNLGTFAAKTQMYTVLARKFSTQELPNAVKQYTEWWNSLDKIKQDVFVTPTRMRMMMDLLMNSKVTGDRFTTVNYNLHYALNRGQMTEALHGDLNAFKDKSGKAIDINALMKRAAQIPTGGRAWSEKKQINTLVIDDSKFPHKFDGQTPLTKETAIEYAKDVGPYSMKGKTEADNIKASIYAVHPETYAVIQIKSNSPNLGQLESPGYDFLHDFLNNYNKEHPNKKIEWIVFTSSFKVGRTKVHDIIDVDPKTKMLSFKKDIGELDLLEIKGNDFITVQDMGHSNTPNEANEGKQYATDMIFNEDRDLITELKNQQFKINAKLLDAIANNASASAVAKILGVDEVDEDEAKQARITAIIVKAMENASWDTEVKPEYYERLFGALENNLDSHNPIYKNAIQQIKARNIEFAGRTKIRRQLSIKVGAGNENLRDFEVVGEHMRLPEIRSNVKSVRHRMKFDSKKLARQWFQASREGIISNNFSVEDMFFLNADGTTSNKLREYEWDIQEDGSVLVPGGYIPESRIPAENVHSHIPHRLVGPIGSSANYSMTRESVMERKGEDLDGDTGFGRVLIANPLTEIERLHNRIMLKEVDFYTQSKNESTVRTQVDAGIYRPYLDFYGTKEVKYKLNTPEHEEDFYNKNARSLATLGIIASNVKFWDLKRKLNIPVNSNGLGTILFDGQLKKAKKHAVLKLVNELAPNDPVQNILHKLFYATHNINMPVDDSSNPYMERLGFNEITLPYAQMLFAMKSSLQGQEAMDYMESIIAWVNTPEVRAFVQERRNMKKVDFTTTMSHSEHLEKTLFKNKNLSKTKIQAVIQVNEIWEEANVISQLLDVQYDAPRSTVEFLQIKSNFKALKKGTFSHFDTTVLFDKDGTIHKELYRLEQIIQQLENTAFNTSILTSTYAGQIFDTLGESFTGVKRDDKKKLDFSRIKTKRMQRAEWIMDRGMVIEALSFKDPTAHINEHLVGYLVSRIADMRKKAQDEGRTNWFATAIQHIEPTRWDILKADKNGGTAHGSIGLSRSFSFREIGDKRREAAQADYDAMPEVDKQAFALYAVAQYGFTESTKRGSYMSLVGTEYAKTIDARISKITDLVFGKNDTVAVPLIDKLVQNVKNDVYGKENNWLENNNPIPLENTPEINIEDVRDIDLNSAQESELLIELRKLGMEESFYSDSDIKKRILESLTAVTVEQKAKLESIGIDAIETQTLLPSVQSVVDESNRIKEQWNKTGYSIVPWSETILPLSIQMTNGGRGIHTVWVKHYNKARAGRFSGRWTQERVEKDVGARQDFQRKEKLTERQKRNGMELLKAITANIQQSTRILEGYSSESMGIEEAVKVVWEMERNRYDEKYLLKKVSVQEYAKAMQVVNRGDAIFASKQMNKETYHKIMLESVLRERSKDGKVIVHTPTWIEGTPQERIDKYNAEKEDWMTDGYKIQDKMIEVFDKALEWNNSQTDVFVPKIPHRSNYAPLYVTNKNHTDGLNHTDYKENEVSSRSLQRGEKVNSYQNAAEMGIMAQETNIAGLYERWMRETSDNMLTRASWQLMILGQNPNGSPVMIPEIDAKNYHKDEMLFTKEMLGFYASRLANNIGMTYKEGQNPLEIIKEAMKEVDTDTHVRMETNIPSMPVVWVQKGATVNLAKMILNQRKEGKAWEIWEHLSAWTKFMAIGVPYMSFFHASALLESGVASKGLNKSNWVYNPKAAWKEYHALLKHLNTDKSITEFWVRHGLGALTTNPDYNQGAVEHDMQWAKEFALKNKHKGTAKVIDRIMETKNNWDRKLWTNFHATLKIMTAEGYLQAEMNNWDKKQGPFPMEQKAKEISSVVNAMYGGNHAKDLLWKTPVTMQMLNSGAFAFDWGYSALKIAGAGNLMPMVFGKPTAMQNRLMFKKYWPAFAAIIMFGVPQAIQALIWGVTRPLGGDPDDMPFTFLNEHDRRTWIDVSPLARPIQKIPVLGKLMGKDDGRRTYIRWGKQAYEIKNWITNPVTSVGHKLTIPLKFIIEQMTGTSMGGWDMAYKDADFFGVMQAQGSFWKGRVGDAVLKFTPFTIQDIIRGKPAILFAKAKKGKHGWYASKQLSELYLGYVNGITWNEAQNHRKEVEKIGSDILHAAALNGFDIDKVHKDALQNARAQLYMELEEAMRHNQHKKASKIGERLIALEASAMKIKQMVASSR